MIRGTVISIVLLGLVWALPAQGSPSPEDLFNNPDVLEAAEAPRESAGQQSAFLETETARIGG